MSLHGTYDPDNIFAKIIRGDMPCVKVFENNQVLAFMDVFPQSEGHTLVIPKNTKARNFLDMPADTLGNYMTQVQKIAKAVEKGLTPDGIRIVQYNGEPAGQTVFHLHFHIIPIWKNADLGSHASGGMVAADALLPVAEKIKAAL